MDNAHTDTNTQVTYTYSVNIINQSSSPILSYIGHTSTYQQVFNPSWIPQSSNFNHHGLMVQTQNCTQKPGVCKQCNLSSSLIFTACDIEQNGHCDDIKSSAKAMSAQNMYTYSQNPSIFYWNNLYYLFLNTPSSSVQMYTSVNPINMSWNLKKSAFAKESISGPVSLLPMNLSHSNNAKHYLFFGGNGTISVTNSCSIEEWQNINYSPWLSPRSGYFDADGVETGSPPIRLRDDNYFMLYNAFKVKNNQTREYEIGWVIFDGKNVSHIIERSAEPLLSSTHDYEIGNAPFLCSSYHSVYAKGIVSIENDDSDNERFRVYYSAADASIGSAIISISHFGVDETPWLKVAIYVSIGSVVFVLAMICVLVCKRKEEGLKEEKLKSLAEAHREEAMSTNASGHYAVGSLNNAHDRDTKTNYVFVHSNNNAENTLLSSSSSLSDSALTLNCDDDDDDDDYKGLKRKESDSVRLSEISFQLNDD